MSATDTAMPSVVDLAREMHAAFVTAGEHLVRAFELGEKLASAATGDLGPQDERVLRLGYELNSGAGSLVRAFRDDERVVGQLQEATDEARDLIDLAELACSPREAATA